MRLVSVFPSRILLTLVKNKDEYRKHRSANFHFLVERNICKKSTYFFLIFRNNSYSSEIVLTMDKVGVTFIVKHVG